MTKNNSHNEQWQCTITTDKKKITMDNDYNKQWQYTIQMNKKAQWTTKTMTNSWYTMNNELKWQCTMKLNEYNDNGQCKQQQW